MHNITLTNFQTQVCIGSLLGDMSASRPKNGKNYHLSCYHSEKQLEWLTRKWDWLQPYSRPIQLTNYTDKRDGKSRKGGRFHTVSASVFTEIAGLFYAPGGKIIPENLSDIMTDPVGLACLIADDGSWNGGGISIASKQFSEKDNCILSECLNKNFNIRTYPHLTGKYWTVNIRSISIENTFALCSPFVPEFLWYKFGGFEYKTTRVDKIENGCGNCGRTFMSYPSENQKYCSRKCAGAAKPKGYESKRPLAICIICKHKFRQYSRLQIRCNNCSDLPLENEKCANCDAPVKKTGRKFCSNRCQVIYVHRKNGHAMSGD